jgi:hypothetical protein
MKKASPESVAEAIHEPLSDWVPLDRAPCMQLPNKERRAGGNVTALRAQGDRR